MKISPKAPALILRKINESKLALREWSMFTAFQPGELYAIVINEYNKILEARKNAS